MSEERPPPDLDHVRDALREHDERTEQEPAEEPREEDGPSRREEEDG
jgi:hypothetical protein